MKKQIIYITILLNAVFILFFSCEKEKPGPSVVTPPPSPYNNQLPVAKAGPDQTINLPDDIITLDGSGSTDPDNNITAYGWSKISGLSSSNIANANAIQTQVTNLGEGIYQFELKVTDSGGLFSKDTMQVKVITQSPPSPPCDNSNRPLVNTQLIAVGTLSKARLGLAVASAGNKIVFAGGSALNEIPECWGSSRIDIYDRVTQVWSTAELSTPRREIAAVAAGNKIFFAGGANGDGAFDLLYSTVDIYDVSTNIWSVASLSVPRSDVAAATVGNKVFFAGGEKDWDYNTSNKVDIYDISASSWSTALLSEPRAGISAVTANNKIYFAGGHMEDRWYANPSGKIDIYDNNSNSWSASSLSEPMGFLAGINVADRIYWAGGCTVEIKNVNTWNSSVAHLFKPGSWTIDDGQNAVIKDNKIIFFTGWGGGNKFDIYNITTNIWSIGILPANIEGASIISVDNTIYIAGGWKNGVLSNHVWKLEF